MRLVPTTNPTSMNMKRQADSSLRSILILLFVTISVVAANPYHNKFRICKADVQGLINGTIESIGDETNTTIWNNGFIYTDNVPELDPHFPRDQYLTLSYKGCKALCSQDVDNAQLNDPFSVMSTIATWIFPLAIVLCLPWESLHRKKKRRTAIAIVNWLGSAQTALTATIFNFSQIREAHRRIKEQSDDSSQHQKWRDIYYVVTCLNQFDLPLPTKNNEFFYRTLVYCLLCPINTVEHAADVVLTNELLCALAHQLRMLRRRSIIPTLANLATFLVAFIISVVLAFAEIGDNTTVDQLCLGLFWSWLPILIIFTSVDRNPVSSERQIELIARWLYNVDAVRSWKDTSLPSPRERSIRFWTPASPCQAEDVVEGSDVMWVRTSNIYRFGGFIGQGRNSKFRGLSWACMEEFDAEALECQNIDYDGCSARIIQRLQGNRPWSWFATAFTALFLVWIELSMAFMAAYSSPSVGLGCWSGSFALFALLSTVSWMLALLFKEPSKAVNIISIGANTLSISWLIIVTIFILTGATNTCYCNSAPFAPAVQRFVSFESASFYIRYCNVAPYWASAAAVGLLIPVAVFIVAIFWWVKCQHLWSSNEGSAMIHLRDMRINWVWLT